MLTLRAQSFKHILAGADVRCIPSRRVYSRSTDQVESDLDSVLKELLEPFGFVNIQQARDALQKRNNQEDIGELFARRRKHRRSHDCVHAEIKIVDFFSRTRREFGNHHRYIGCSKPSCYCCSLYIQAHPSKVETRPSHGNAWVKWTAPRQKSSSGLDMVLVHMINHMRYDLVAKFSKDMEPSCNMSLLESKTGTSLESRPLTVPCSVPVKEGSPSARCLESLRDNSKPQRI